MKFHRESRFWRCLEKSGIGYTAMTVPICIFTTISNGMQKNACEYMLQTEESMDQIARKVGFTTVSTFNRNFKKFLDISPYQWKIKPDNYERKLQNYHITALKGW